MSKSVDVVVMAAGKGTRMKSKLPKVLHRLGGRALAAHVIDTAARLLARQVVVITGHGASEVEAALDEANVLRFGRYLRTFEKDTQFIVVTHRKGTMESADMLYGVTMAESGVSKLVSVRLEEIAQNGQIQVLEGERND